MTTTPTTLNRRKLLVNAAWAGLVASTPLGAQIAKPRNAQRNPAVVQIVDTSMAQQDVSRDFLIGSRAAWQDINTRGGIRGRTIEHISIETDGSTASLRTAVDTIKSLPNCIALSGTAGDRAAGQLVGLLNQDQLEIAHVAPWLLNSGFDGDECTFSIFASHQEQITHALGSLSTMGVKEIGAVYASAQEYLLYHTNVERTATRLKIRLQTYEPTGNLKGIGQSLTPVTPAILLFLGGTPELVQFTQGIEKQARQRYVVALADVNLQTLMQMGAARNTPVIATQVVPMVTASMPVVRNYRETLSRLFDEAPTPLSLAGFIAARYTQEVLATVEGTPTRPNILQAFRRRSTIDVGGFRVSFNEQNRSGAYVTQSMLATDGRVIG
jgi:ABC-type branched-subunit amino acid transport system substrate-binding protein